MLRPHDDIYGMFPAGVPSRVPGGVPPSSPVGPWVGPPVTAFPGVSPAVPGGGGVPGSSPVSPEHTLKERPLLSSSALGPGTSSKDGPGSLSGRTAEVGAISAHENGKVRPDWVETAYRCELSGPGADSLCVVGDQPLGQDVQEHASLAVKLLASDSDAPAKSVQVIEPQSEADRQALQAHSQASRCYCYIERRTGTRTVKDITIKWWYKWFSPTGIYFPVPHGQTSPGPPVYVGPDIKKSVRGVTYMPIHLPPLQGQRYKPPAGKMGIGFWIPEIRDRYDFQLFSETTETYYQEIVTSKWVVCRPPPARCDSERELVGERVVARGPQVGEPLVSVDKSPVLMGLGFPGAVKAFVGSLDTQLAYLKSLSEPPTMPAGWKLPQPDAVEPPVRNAPPPELDQSRVVEAHE